MRGVVLGLFFLLAGCGRVGAPLPPFIRIPEPVTDLTAVQSGYELTLTWTNPALYIDGSAATDLSRAHLFRNGLPVMTLDVNGPGQKQSYSVPARALVGATHGFSVQIETLAGKLATISSAVSIMPVEVPGPVTTLRPIFDQSRITIEWDLPAENEALVTGYIVGRSDGQSQAQVTDRKFADENIEEGKTYTYSVTAVRLAGNTQIAGVAGPGVVVTAKDITAPQVPRGLEIASSDQGAFLTWTANTEEDLAGYRVFRSDRADTGFMLLTEKLAETHSFFDPEYRPGLYYAVSAVDVSRNESRMSDPYHEP